MPRWTVPGKSCTVNASMISFFRLSSPMYIPSVFRIYNDRFVMRSKSITTHVNQPQTHRCNNSTQENRRCPSLIPPAIKIRSHFQFIRATAEIDEVLLKLRRDILCRHMQTLNCDAVIRTCRADEITMRRNCGMSLQKIEKCLCRGRFILPITRADEMFIE